MHIEKEHANLLLERYSLTSRVVWMRSIVSLHLVNRRTILDRYLQKSKYYYFEFLLVPLFLTRSLLTAAFLQQEKNLSPVTHPVPQPTLTWPTEGSLEEFCPDLLSPQPSILAHPCRERCLSALSESSTDHIKSTYTEIVNISTILC